MLSKFGKGFLLGAAVRSRHSRVAPKAPDQPESPSGYGTWVAWGAVMGLLNLFWMWLFWGHPFFIFMGIIWLAFTVVVCNRGFREAATIRRR
jgi:hypothetical protein